MAGFGPFAFLDRTYPTIEEDLAADEALLNVFEERGDVGGVVRVWEPSRLAVVLGASGRLREDVDVERCREEGVAIARRSSGGGTVVVGPGTLNLTVVLATDAGPGLDAVDRSQAFVLERCAEALRSRGPEVVVRGSGDLTIGGRKFAGSAQRRLRRSFLIHASMIYAMPIETIARYTRLPKRQPEYRAGRSHEDFLTSLPLGREVMVGALRGAWSGDEAGWLGFEELDRRIPTLVEEKFGDRGWVERL